MNEITAVITQEQAKISCNFEQVEEAIKDVLSEYEGAVFAEENKALAKKHVASLRNQKKVFQDNLREAKKEYMKPWDEFEGQAKTLIGMYDEPINLINDQIQAFEAKRIAKKKEKISALYGKLVPGELVSYIPLDRIYNPKWENATFKEKDIRDEISGKVDTVQKDIATIRGMDSDAEEQAIAGYRINLDLTEAVNYIQAYEQRKKAILEKEQERKRIEEEARIRREEKEKLLAEQRAREEKEAALQKAEEEKEAALIRAEEEKAVAVEQAKAEAEQEFIDSLIPNSGEEENLYEYRISLSDDAKKKLEMYMDSVGIEWERI